VPVASEALVELAAQAERRVEAINKIKQILASTDANLATGLTKMDDPYLQVSGG